jgi:hypothetical protein
MNWKMIWCDNGGNRCSGYCYDNNNAFSSSSSISNSSREQEVLHEPSALEVVMRDFYSSMPLHTKEQTNESNHTNSFGSRNNVGSDWNRRH